MQTSTASQTPTEDDAPAIGTPHGGPLSPLLANTRLPARPRVGAAGPPVRPPCR